MSFPLCYMLYFQILQLGGCCKPSLHVLHAIYESYRLPGMTHSKTVDLQTSYVSKLQARTENTSLALTQQMDHLSVHIYVMHCNKPSDSFAADCPPSHRHQVAMNGTCSTPALPSICLSLSKPTSLDCLYSSAIPAQPYQLDQFKAPDAFLPHYFVSQYGLHALCSSPI